MEKSIIKKNVHLSEKEKQYVARLIQDGGTIPKVPIILKSLFLKNPESPNFLVSQIHEKQGNRYCNRDGSPDQSFYDKPRVFI